MEITEEPTEPILSEAAKHKMIKIAQDILCGTPWNIIQGVHKVNFDIVKHVKDLLETYSQNIRKFEDAVNEDCLMSAKVTIHRFPR